MAKGKKEKANKANEVALQPKETQSPLNVIRTETVLSRLPIHNLNRRGTFEIKITKKKENGEVDLHWEVSANSEYGEPRQLAYKVDTIVINRLVDLHRRNLPKLLCLGSTREVCLALGMEEGGTNALNLQKALKQNAGTLIVAKVNYKDKDGLARSLDAAFSRYSVIMRGERLPDGTFADAIYINFSDIYFEVLKNVPVRPLDFEYLKELPPSSQRFYEILSYKIFAAFTNSHSVAVLPYSDFCTFSAQTRYYDYEPFRKQMYKIHKPHLDSGYIANLEYKDSKDDEGKRDWLMCYKPGPKARQEYETFNNRKKYSEEDLAYESIYAMFDAKEARKQSKAPLPTKAKIQTAKPKAKTTLTKTAVSLPDNSKANDSEALLLVQQFHLLARGVENYQPYNGSREQSQAQSLLNNYGKEKAFAIVSFSVKEAKRTNFEMRTFGAIFQYVSDAIAEYEKITKETKRKADEEAKKKKEFDSNFARIVASLTPKQYHDLYEQAKQQLLTDIPSVTAEVVETNLQSLLKSVMIDLLERNPIKNQK
jgi:hypothetical protein